MKMLFAFLWVKIQNDVMTLRGRCSLKGQPKQKKEKHNTRECAKPKTEIIQKKTKWKLKQESISKSSDTTI